MEFIMSALSTVDRSRGDYICEDGSSPKHSGNQSVIGVIGAASSPVSAMVANILRLFHVSLFLFLLLALLLFLFFVFKTFNILIHNIRLNAYNFNWPSSLVNKRCFSLMDHLSLFLSPPFFLSLSLPFLLG